MGTKISALNAGATVGGTEKIPAVQSAATVYLTPAQLMTYVNTTLAAGTEVDPALGGDMLVAYRSGTLKTIDIDTLETYCSALAVADVFGGTTQTTLLDADVFVFQRSGTTSKVTAANLAAYVLDGVQADVLDISGLGAATLTGTDDFLVEQSGTAKKVTLANLEAKLWVDHITYTAALSDITTLQATDEFRVQRSGTAYTATPAEMATYTMTAIAAQGAVSPWATGDKFPMVRGSTWGMATLDDLATYISADIQTDLLDVSGLGAATLGATDYLLVCQGTTPKQAQLSAFATFVHTNATYGLSAYVAGLSPSSAGADTDLYYVVQGGTGKYITGADLAAYINTAASSAGWSTVSSSSYTATPASTSQITMSDTTGMVVGLPLKYAYNGATYYGIITAVSASTSITIAGAPLNVSYALTKLEYGGKERVRTIDLCVAGAYSGSVQTILANVGLRYLRWREGAAYLVAIAAAHDTVDTGATQPKLNVTVGGDAVSTEDSNDGLTMSGSQGTWVDGSAVAIHTTNYAVSRNDAIELSVTDAGDNNDAEDLSVSLTFVLG